jgi:hypothetical protein
MAISHRGGMRRHGRSSKNGSVCSDALIVDSSYATESSRCSTRAQPEPNDFDCIVVLQAGTRYETLQPFQRWVADTREASRRYRGDIFVARTDQPTLDIYCDFFAMNRHGKQIGLVEVTL